MKTIKILGGGISGLTAAINLRRHVFAVEVYERKNHCGKNTNDFQFLENWTFSENVLEFLKSINIRTGFYKKPIRRAELLSPNLARYCGKSREPMMYLVKRGKAKDSIDRSLEKQAKEEGVKIIYDSSLKESEADIIAKGFKEPSFMAAGVKFKLKHADKSIVLLDNNLSLNFYSYFIVNDNVGEIVCVNPAGTKDINGRLNATVRTFEKILGIKIKKVDERFGAPVNFGYLGSDRKGKQYFVGESAGFQDYLAGFGMVLAFKSGYLAAMSIIEGKDYDKLWKESFLRQLDISARNRAAFERLTNDDFDRMINLLNSKAAKMLAGSDAKAILRKIYNSPMLSYLSRIVSR